MSHIESQKRKRLDGPQNVAILKRYLVDKTRGCRCRLVQQCPLRRRENHCR